MGWFLNYLGQSKLRGKKLNLRTLIVMSLKHQLLDFPLKSPITTVRKGLLVDSVSRLISRFDLNV